MTDALEETRSEVRAGTSSSISRSVRASHDVIAGRACVHAAVTTEVGNALSGQRDRVVASHTSQAPKWHSSVWPVFALLHSHLHSHPRYTPLLLAKSRCLILSLYL